MLTHLDGVTSLSINAAGFSPVSGSRDCQSTTQREKAREGVLDMDFYHSWRAVVPNPGPELKSFISHVAF